MHTRFRSFVLIISRNNRTEFGGPKGLKRNTKRNAVALAHTKHTTQAHKRMKETLRLAVKSMKVSRQYGEAKYSTVKRLHKSKFTAPSDVVTMKNIESDAKKSIVTQY